MIAENGAPVAEATFEFATVELDPPAITEITVTENETDVLLDKVITVTLSEAFKEGTEQTIKLTVKDSDVNLITGYQLSNENKTVTLVHADFTINTEYVLTIPATVKGAVSDLSVTETVRNFKTYESEVTATLNAEGNNVAATTQLQLTFARAINEAGIENITLRANGEEVEINPSLDGAVVSLNNGTLNYVTEYTVTIPDGLTATNGIPVAEDTFTFTTQQEPAEGTLIWSEDFEGLNAENIAAERPYWSLTLVSGGSANTYKTSDGTLTWAAAEETYNSRFAIVDGKAQLSKKRSTYDGNDKVQLVMKMDEYDDAEDNIIQPNSGYTVFEYDYYSDALPFKDRLNEWSTNVHDVQLYEAENAWSSRTRTYGRFDITSVNGIQDFTDCGSSPSYADVVCGTHKENIRSAEGIEGQNVHIQVVYDINNGNGYRYMVFATVNGEKSYRSTDWIELTTATCGQAPAWDWFFDTIALEQREAPDHGSDFSVVTYDNFKYTHYTTLPSFVSATVTDGAEDVARVGSFGVTFSKKIDATSIGSIAIKKDDEVVDGVDVVMNGEKGVTVNYARLAANTTYTLVIPKTVTDLNGLPLTAEETITFTTNNDKFPEILGATVTDGAENILLDKVIAVTFDEAIDEDTIDDITLTVKDSEGNLITGYELSNEGKTVTFTHEPFTMNTDYVLTVPDTVKASATGFPLEEGKVYNFKTYESEVTATINVSGNEVDVETQLQVTFTEAVTQAVADSITLTAGEGVAVTATLDGTEKIVTLSATLDYETAYTVTVPTGLTAKNGVPITTATFNFTTMESPVGGTVLWSEDFTGITNENAGTLRPYWSATAKDWDGSAQTDYSASAGGDWTKTSTEGISQRVVFEDGKLVLQDKLRATHNSMYASVVMPFRKTEATFPSIPSTGYAVFEFEYEAENTPVAPIIEPRTLYMDDIRNSGRKYGSLSITETYGIEDMLTLGSTLENRANNIRTADDIEGKVVKIQYVFDIANRKYMVSATVDGKKSFNGTEWMDYSMATSGVSVEATKGGEYYFNRITLVQNDVYADAAGYSTAKYDNFLYTHYTADKLPSFLRALIGEDELTSGAVGVDASGEIDVVFDRAIDPASIGGITLVRTEDDEPVNVQVVMNGEKTATVRYSGLHSLTEYELTIPKTVTAVNGLPLTSGDTITFTTKELQVGEFDYNLEVSADKDIYNAGETVTADIIATGTESFSSYGFTLDYDDTALQLTNVTSTLLGQIDYNASNGMVAFESMGSDIAIAPEGTVIATAKFRVLDATGEQTIALTDAEMTPSGYDGNKAPTTTPDTFNVYSIKVNFVAGNGVTLSQGATTAYAKYNESGLYTDTNYTSPYTIPQAMADIENGWLLPETYWKSGENFFTAAQINDAIYTQSVTYTATAEKKLTVTISAGDYGTFTDPEQQTEFEVDYGTMLGELGLPTPQANTGYVFTGWKPDDSDFIIDNLDTYDVTAHITLVAQYAPSVYNFAVSDFQNGAIDDLAGVVNEKATYGTDVTFKVIPNDGYIVDTVVYTVGDAETPVVLHPDQLGYYTIDGLTITGDVTVTVELFECYTVTFKAGTGTTMETVVAYAGARGVYASLEALKLGGEPDFEIPTPVAQADYRLAADEADEPLWRDADGNGITSEGIYDKPFTANTVYTAVAIRQYTVTFTVGEEVTEDKVDEGKTVTPPDVTADPGYVFNGWVDDEGIEFVLDTPVYEDLSLTAVIEKGKYLVTFAKHESVTVNPVNGLDNDSCAEVDTDVEFTIDSSFEIQSVTYQIGDGEVQNVPEVDGTYIIPGSAITDAVTVTITTVNEYTVTFDIDGQGTVDPGSVPVAAGGRITEAPVTTPADGYVFTGWYNAEDVEVNLLEEVINGNVTYTAKFELAKRTITLPQNVTANYQSGYDNGYAQFETDVVFTVEGNGIVVTHIYYKVKGSEGDPVELVAENGVYTIDGNLIKDDIEITADIIENATAELVEVNYMISQVYGKKIFMLKAAESDEIRYVFKGGAAMFWNDRYEAYVAFVDAEATVEALVAGITTKTDNVADYVIIPGDVNGNGFVTAADAGIINDCLRNQREEAITPKQIFAMDIAGIKNEEGYQKVTTEDIVAVLIEAVK